MKRIGIVLSLAVTVALVAMMAYGVVAGGAWFTDAATTSEANVTTGSLDLEVTYEWGDWSVQNLEPGAGYSQLGGFCVKNVGDYDIRFHGWIKDPVITNSLAQFLTAKAVLNPEGMPPVSNQYGPDELMLFEDIAIKDLQAPNQYIATSAAAEPLYADYVACYGFEVALSSDATNLQQNGSYSGSLYIEAIQAIDTSVDW